MFNKLRTLVFITTITLLAFNLSSCANAALAVADPRPLSTVMSDTELTQSLNIDYANAGGYKDLEVTVYDSKVLLTGRVSNSHDNKEAVKIAYNNTSITKVYNYLVVEDEKSYQSSTINDSYITAKVKTDLFDTGGISSNDVKLVTNAGVVYIFGLIPADQENRIYQEARTISGVRKVVMLIEKQKPGQWF